jgi:hypothetical protein
MFFIEVCSKRKVESLNRFECTGFAGRKKIWYYRSTVAPLQRPDLASIESGSVSEVEDNREHGFKVQ